MISWQSQVFQTDSASTGIAACNVDGCTLHSFGGVGLAMGTAEELYDKVIKNKNSTNRWRRTKVLVIDEVSMTDGHLFDKIDYIARRIRNTERAFGGIQLIICGDFLQLPPGNNI
jgi:ATP-dependent DNA helicase PIF1